MKHKWRQNTKGEYYIEKALFIKCILSKKNIEFLNIWKDILESICSRARNRVIRK